MSTPHAARPRGAADEMKAPAADVEAGKGAKEKGEKEKVEEGKKEAEPAEPKVRI